MATVTTIIQQSVWADVRIFVVLKWRWKVSRRGRYTFRKTDGKWKIARVEVLEESKA